MRIYKTNKWGVAIFKIYFIFLYLVTVFQIFLGFDDFDSSEEYWLDALQNLQKYSSIGICLMSFS